MKTASDRASDLVRKVGDYGLGAYMTEKQANWLKQIAER